jgi:hypothetical protein
VVEHLDWIHDEKYKQEQSDDQPIQDSKHLPTSRPFCLHPAGNDSQRCEREDADSINHYRGYQYWVFEMATGELGAVFVKAEIISTKKGGV